MSTPATPKDAATVVLLRDGAAGLEVLMVRRKKGAAFMAEALVFPGGRVDDEDIVSHPVTGAEAIGEEATIAEIGGDRAHALTCCVAAIREVFEEAAVLLAVDGSGAPLRDNLSPELCEGREAVHAGTRGFRELCAELDLRLDVGALVFFARWITPEAEMNRRFDARFYLAAMPPGQTPAHDPIELTEHVWATPQALLDDIRSKLPPPTQWHLTDLARHRTVSDALGWARGRRVATVRPKLVGDPVTGGPMIVLPWDSEYPSLPGATFPLDRSVPVAGPLSRFVLFDGKWRGSAK